MKRKNKRNKVMFLILLLLAISIGFAALATTLKINGNASVTKGSWNIYWDADSISVASGSVSATAPVVGQDTGDALNTKVTWGVNFSVPGEFYEFTIDAVNAGSMDAVITDIESTITDGTDPVQLPSYIGYTVRYADNTSITVNDPLNKADSSTTPATPTRKTYKIRIEFLDTVTPEELDDIPSAGLNYELEYDVIYGQASVNNPSSPQLVQLKACNQNISGKTDEQLVPLYSCQVTGFNTIYPINWDLFYSDEDYIFLIADDYVESKYLPAEIYKNAGRDYACGFANYGERGLILDDPRWSSGSQSDAIQNNPLKDKYLKWVNTYPNSTNDNVRATAYMMDTSIWANFAGTVPGAFAMGGPTLELFIASYNATHILQLVKYDEIYDQPNYGDYNANQYGYRVKWEPFYGNQYGWSGSSNYGPYLFNTNEVPNMWDRDRGPVTDVWAYYIASPGTYYSYDSSDQGRATYIYYSQRLSCSNNVDSPWYSFRPLVAIPKSSLR